MRWCSTGDESPKGSKGITSNKEAPERFPEEVWREPVLKYRKGLNRG